MNLNQLFTVTKNLNVLYIEDEENVRKQYTIFFKKIFHTVDTAKDGLEGINSYDKYYQENKKTYDLVISDITMPNMDGIEMCQNILTKTPDQQILIISAYNDSDKLQKIMSLGIHSFIQKPMNLENITKVLDKVCTYIAREKKIKDKIHKMEQTVENLKTELEKAIHEKESFEEDVFGLYTLLEDYEITSMTDKEGHILEVNNEFERVSGYKKRDIIGEKFDFFRNEEVSKKIWDTIETIHIFRGEIKNKSNYEREGYYWTDLIVVPMIKDEEVYGFKFIEENITENKSADHIIEDIFGDGVDLSFDFNVETEDNSTQTRMLHANDEELGIK